MNVVLIMVNLFKVNLRIVLGNLEQFPLNIGKQSWVKDFTTVFSRKDNMIVTKVDAVVISTILGHVVILTRRSRCGYWLPPRPYGRGFKLGYMKNEKINF